MSNPFSSGGAELPVVRRVAGARQRQAGPPHGPLDQPSLAAGVPSGICRAATGDGRAEGWAGCDDFNGEALYATIWLGGGKGPAPGWGS